VEHHKGDGDWVKEGGFHGLLEDFLGFKRMSLKSEYTLKKGLTKLSGGKREAVVSRKDSWDNQIT